MLLTIFLVALATGVCVSSITYLLFWYEAANSPHQATLKTCSGRRGLLRCIVCGFISSVFSLIVAFIAYPLGCAKRLWSPSLSPGCSRPPLLLVHGLYHNASAWVLYSWLLRRAGFTTLRCWSYNSLKYDFWQLASQFKDVLRETSALCGGAEVVCIGHSMGGLLIRSALADPGVANLIAAAITLGAPNHGSRLATLAVGRLGRSIIHNGELVQKLNAMRSPSGLPKLNIYSPIDNMVLPTSSLSASEPGWEEMTTAPISHVSMLYHLPTIGLVLDFLEKNFPNPLPASVHNTRA